MGGVVRNLFVNLCLLLVSCVVGLSLCEVSLRLFYPKYLHLAEAQFHHHATRIWARIPNSRDWMSHPDTGVPHSLYHNNLALRQHRDFSEADLAAATNVGVFGDSYTENIGLAAPYSFTEPLDYLLNQSGARFNVLNFGVSGYGPGQSFLHYEHFRYVDDLDYILFMWAKNDIRNIYETNLFHLEDTGQLRRNEAVQLSRWVQVAQRLHILYLLLDVNGTLTSFIEGALVNEELQAAQRERYFDSKATSLYRDANIENQEFKTALDVFRQLVRLWKQLVEHRGGRFLVLVVPDFPVPLSVTDMFNEEEIKVLDLHDCFRDYDDSFHWRKWHDSPYGFKHDTHWNEAGNRLAAGCVYRLLEEEMGLPRLSEDRLQEAFFRYYAAFGEGGLPRRGEAEDPISLETAAAIREKYLALDMSSPLTDFKEYVLEVMASPDKRIIASDFHVYSDQNRLIFIKEECRPADIQARFFLHLIPVDERDLPEDQRQYGFDNLDFRHPGFQLDNKTCATVQRLPGYAIRHIRTGQFVRDDEGGFLNLWEGEFVMEHPAGGLERRTGN